MRILLILLIACLLNPASVRAADEPLKPANDIPLMQEEAAAAGIEHSYVGPWEFFVGGGGAAFDCNADSYPDLFLAGGKAPAALYVNRATSGGPLAFEKHALPDDLPLDMATGAYPIDIDNDARLDLVVLRVGRNLLLKGGPDCTFTFANKAWGFDGGKAWTTAFAARWEEGRRFPTLAFGNYVDRAAAGSPWGTCHDNELLRPEAGDGPRYETVTPLVPGYCVLSMLFTDWNKSGLPALRLSNDRQYYRGGEEQLWRMEAGKTPRLYGRGDGWRKLSIWGMGIAEGDLNGDGFPEYALTSMGDTMLQTLDEEAAEDAPVYRDIAYERGATAHRPYAGGDLKPSTGWHAEFQDFNNDGLLDLFIAKGNVEAMADFAANDPDNLLLGQWDGRFAEAGADAGIALPRKGRGALIADYNLDGALDLLVVNRDGPVSLFRNLGAKTEQGSTPLGNWLSVRLSERGANRLAVGAKVNVKIGTRTLLRTVQVGGGHASGVAGWLHFGLGTSERAEIRVQWPDGAWSHPYRVFANQHVVIERDKPIAGYFYPRTTR